MSEKVLFAQPQLNGEQYALPPSQPMTEPIEIPDNDPIIFPGVNEREQHEVAFSLDSMFDEYIDIANDTREEFPYDTGEKMPGMPVVNENGDIVTLPGDSIYRFISKNEILSTKLADLKLYTKGSMNPKELGVYFDLLLKDGHTSLNDLVDSAVSAYVEDRVGFTDDQVHPDEEEFESQGEISSTQPSHVRFTEIDSNPETTSKFRDIVAYTFGKLGLKSSGFVNSQSLETVSKKEEINT